MVGIAHAGRLLPRPEVYPPVFAHRTDRAPPAAIEAAVQRNHQRLSRWNTGCVVEERQRCLLERVPGEPAEPGDGNRLLVVAEAHVHGLAARVDDVNHVAAPVGRPDGDGVEAAAGVAEDVRRQAAGQRGLAPGRQAGAAATRDAGVREREAASRRARRGPARGVVGGRRLDGRQLVATSGSAGPIARTIAGPVIRLTKESPGPRLTGAPPACCRCPG